MTQSADIMAARDLVERIAFDHGHLSEEHFSKIQDPTTRRLFKEALGKKDQLIGSSVVTLAKELYSKDVRFIFELLQNADDNLFRRARDSGHEPYLIFRVYHDRIVVDCNEDGFEEANLRAICNVGQSSKVGRQGYIGEKGIGFKSVFKVAWKVHIQSGAFSFCFKHRPTDSGMGMISPEWHPAEDLPEPMTRMTFVLHDDGDGDIRAAQRKSIDDEFEHLQPSMMLFLNNIKRIEVRFFDKDNRETKSSVMTRSECVVPNRAVLENFRTKDGDGGKKDTTTSRLNYHLTKGKATGLAKNENRAYSPAEETSRAYSKADIVLAFPLDENSVPIDRPQNIFAFLPMRHVGFNFLIHSDFVTMANRENIVTSSLRNQGIRQHIARTFVLAVKQMCEHPELRFQWMRFLPSHTGYHTNDSFWAGFVTLLKQELLGADIIFPRLGVLQRSIKQVKRFPRTPTFLDQHEEPLFDDLAGWAARYISKGYKGVDLDRLRHYGLESLSIDDMILRVQADLKETPSKMRSGEADADWHSRVARVLKHGFTSGPPQVTNRIRAMNLLPLNDGQWTNLDQTKSPVCFPTTSNGTKIPAGLGIRLICPNAATHPDRKDLFSTLGVLTATDDTIRSIVLKKYATCWPSLEHSIAWLKFLYLTRPQKPEWPAKEKDVSIVSSTGKNIETLEADIYFPDDKNEYGAAKLGLEVNFLHPDYLDDPPLRPGEELSTADRSWRKWLHSAIGIRKYLRLVSPDGSAISDQVLHVAQHRPERFLGLLHHLWPYEGGKVQSNEVLCTNLKEVKVLCEDGDKYPLSETILPALELKTLSSQFLREGEHLPFLELKHTKWDRSIGGWEFLDALDVVKNDGLAFHLGMLSCIADYNNPTDDEGSDMKDPSRLVALYQAIHGKVIASASPEEARELVRFVFKSYDGIFVPKSPHYDSNSWVSPEGCLLEAPIEFQTITPIDTIFDHVFGKAMSDMETVRHFFRDTLGIRRLGWRDYVTELEWLHGSEYLDLIEALYRGLKTAQLNVGDTKELRKLFRDNRLICSGDGGEAFWHTTEECLWSTGSNVQGLINLAGVYDADLESFFVESLGVTRLTVQLVYDELLSLADKHITDETIPHVKRQLLAFSSLLRDKASGDTPAPAPLLEKPILPVKQVNGKVLPLPASSGFTIIDRAGPMAQFYDMVKTLDFTMEQVHDLEPFLRWAGLEGRYLSRMVEEALDLGSGERFRISEPRYNLRNKAHGLVRVAKHFRSPRFSGNGQALYDLLRDSETWETDDISARLTLTIDGETHSIKLEQGDVYITGEDSSPLKIFIPHNEIAQDVCVQHTLPRKLVEWLMMSPQAESHTPVNERAVGLITGLLNARLASVPTILTGEGILDIDLENRDVDNPDSVITRVEPPQTPSRSSSSSPETPQRVFTPMASVSLETPMTDPFSSPSPSLLPLSRPTLSSPLLFREHHPIPEPQVSAGVDAYRQLLNHMIQAGKKARFPDQTVFDMSPLLMALDGDTSYNLPASFSSSNFSTFQLGAAGELFVFEILKSLGPSLPAFSRSNWTSNIKTQVKIHPDYETMQPWSGGAEISDLQYTDTTGLFTSLLIEKGHLPPAKWTGKRPSYYFEVKSTPRACNEPFYMSDSQYKKMKRLCAEGDKTVYIIFRVFNMFSGKINVKLYVNPAELERQGQLDFSADTYTVRARA